VVVEECVEELRTEIDQSCVRACQREAPQQHIESNRLGGVVALVAEVCFVDDLCELPERGIVEVVAAEDRLEAAVSLARASLGFHERASPVGNQRQPLVEAAPRSGANRRLLGRRSEPVEPEHEAGSTAFCGGKALNR
jgi:hypothetical protein